MVIQMAQHRIAAGFLRIPPPVPVDPLKHEFPQTVHGLLHQGAHGQMGPAGAFPDHIGNHRIDPGPMAVPQHPETVPGELEVLQDPGPQGIVQIVIQIGDPVRLPDAFRFRGFGPQGAGVAQNPAADLRRQVQAAAVVFETVHHPEALLIMAEALRQKIVQGSLPDMPVGGMAKIMPQGDGLRQILVEPERPGDGSGHLSHLQGMGQPRPVMIPLGGEKNLGLELQPAKGLAVNNPIPVPLKGCSQIAGGLGPRPPGAVRRVGRPGGQQQGFLLFQTLPNRHPSAPFPAVQ